jgi:acyl-CoA synthetase (AMP-forming)/AMP-acid ligase II
VADASVFGFPDQHYGETVAAAIRPSAAGSAGLTGPAHIADSAGSAGDGLAGELAEFCRARLAAYKVPVRWLFTDAFPLTPSGKIRKDALRERLADRSPT